MEQPPAGREGVSAPPDIQALPVPAGGGDVRRIPLPVSPVAAGSPWGKLVGSAWGFIRFAGIAAIVVAVFTYGRLAERVDNTTQSVKVLGDIQEKEKDRVSGFFERLAMLEAKVDNAIKSGGSTAALVEEVASLRQALAVQRVEHGFLEKRIEEVAARLASLATDPGTP